MSDKVAKSVAANPDDIPSQRLLEAVEGDLLVLINKLSSIEERCSSPPVYKRSWIKNCANGLLLD